MRLRSPFRVSQPDLEQPERDHFAPIRDLYEPYDGRQAWWTAHLPLETPGCAVHHEKALRTCLPPAIKIVMLLEAAMLRYCGAMTPAVKLYHRRGIPLDLRRGDPGQGAGLGL